MKRLHDQMLFLDWQMYSNIDMHNSFCFTRRLGEPEEVIEADVKVSVEQDIS